MPKPCVLVVDDSALIRQVITDTFAPAGYDVLAAANGAEALALLQQRAPDLIIADILMPVMDGWALCDEVRRRPETKSLPFIFLTTERDVPKRIKGLEMGADDYVCKPFSKEELLARAEGLLRRAGRAEPATSPAGEASTSRLQGHTDHIPMPDLMQLLSMNGRSGTLTLWGESVARVYFLEGRIINAETQGLKGEKALFRIMAWPSARFEFDPGEPARPIETAVSGNTPTVLMEGFKHLDELRDLIDRLPPRSRRLRVPPAVFATLPGLPAESLTTAQRIVLFAAGEHGSSLAEIIDAVPENDLIAYAAVGDLMSRGLLEAIDEDAQR